MNTFFVSSGIVFVWANVLLLLFQTGGETSTIRQDETGKHQDQYESYQEHIFEYEYIFEGSETMRNQKGKRKGRYQNYHDGGKSFDFEDFFGDVAKHRGSRRGNGKKERKTCEDEISEDAANRNDLILGCAFSNNANEFRTIDGSFNNRKNSTHGASVTAFAETFRPAYDDSINAPRGSDPNRLYNGYRLPTAREIAVEFRSEIYLKDPNLTNMHQSFALLVVAEIMNTIPTQCGAEECSNACTYVEPCFPIPIPDDDPFLDNRKQCSINLVRNIPICGTGTSKKRPRKTHNVQTSYIDASAIYGQDADTARRLRDPQDFALLRTGTTEYATSTGKPLLPFQTDADSDLNDCPPTIRQCFVSGARLTNFLPGLITMPTLFVREHNRLATRLRQINPTWKTEQVYQEARKIVGAVLQQITYREYLPAIFPGIDTILGEYRGYDPKVDASIFNGFGSAAFRLHHMIKPVIERLGPNYTPFEDVDLRLAEVIFAPELIVENGLDAFIRADVTFAARKPSPLTLFLDEFLSVSATDVGSLDIQRGRDQGLENYNTWRSYCGLPSCDGEGFDCYSKEIGQQSVRNKLEKLYGNTKNVDLWVGGVAEDLVGGALFGPTFQCIIADQFRRLRDGDSFWYERKGVFSREQLDEIKKVSLARIICDNSDDIKRVPEDVFRLSDPNTYTSCGYIKEINLDKWKAIDTCS